MLWWRGQGSLNTFLCLGIPFAQPPIGNLRFAPPVLLDTPGNGTLDATQFGAPCVQFNVRPVVPYRLGVDNTDMSSSSSGFWRFGGLPHSEHLPALRDYQQCLAACHALDLWRRVSRRCHLCVQRQRNYRSERSTSECDPSYDTAASH